MTEPLWLALHIKRCLKQSGPHAKTTLAGHKGIMGVKPEMAPQDLISQGVKPEMAPQGLISQGVGWNLGLRVQVG